MQGYRWLAGDLHSHCGISYGIGGLAEALTAAADHLDFCSVTGHANWPDMPTDRSRYGALIDYHVEGFERLAGQWDQVTAAVEAANREGEFVTFHSFEWHNLGVGDHNVYFPGAGGPLFTADDLDQLRQRAAPPEALVIPHHIGYGPGLRGIEWDAFDPAASPFVEIMSLHGCSESDTAPYPLLHTMGPRVERGTAEHGFRRGLRFGLVGGTDHHGAYPGSYGDGRMMVLADDLTRASLWEAFCARRVYALTGDRIEADFRINDVPIGQEFTAGRRHLSLDVSGSDWLEGIEILKNERRFAWFPGPDPAVVKPTGRWKVRVEWGWSEKDKTVDWEGELRLDGGRIVGLERCFTGPPIVAPGDVEDEPRLRINRVLQQDETSAAWLSHTQGNPTMHHRATQALVFELEAEPATRLGFSLNEETVDWSLAELAAGSRSRILGGWLGPAVRFHRAIPSTGYEFQWFAEDEPELELDVYRARIWQRNGQWAWLTPIWVNSG